MRAMRTYAKKKECMNAPIGPFTTFTHCVYGYNIRNELISAAKNTEHQYQYDELDSPASDGGVAYAYDAAGNRTTKTENGETITYTLGLSDGLASWMSMGSSSMGSYPMDVTMREYWCRIVWGWLSGECFGLSQSAFGYTGYV